MTKAQRPPTIAQNILSSMLPKRDREIILGDFSEEHAKLQEGSKLLKANLWYWKELLLSVPILISVKIRRFIFGRQLMKIAPFFQPGRKTALWSLLFLLPATLLTIPGIVQSFSGSDLLYSVMRQSLIFGEINLWDWIINPAIVLSGLFIALFISFFSVVGISITNEGESLVGTLSMEKSTWNLFPLVLTIGLGTAIFVYLVVENFGPII